MSRESLATLYRLNWFFPAAMVIVGAHYLPFVFLYGMRQFAVLAAAMIGGGVGGAVEASFDAMNREESRR